MWLMEKIRSKKNGIEYETLSYGYGDGGGGPEFEMIEMAERLKDVGGFAQSRTYYSQSIYESVGKILSLSYHV